jgi:hypothetical protein
MSKLKIDILKESKAFRILSRVQCYIGGDIHISKRSVPHLVIDHYSICYFQRSRCIKLFSGYKTVENKLEIEFKQFVDLVRYMHYNLVHEH